MHFPFSMTFVMKFMTFYDILNIFRHSIIQVFKSFLLTNGFNAFLLLWKTDNLMSPD